MIYHSMILLRKLDSSLDLARTQATGANINALNFALNIGANALDVWLPRTLSLQMRMADIIAAELTLAAYFTYICHIDTSYSIESSCAQSIHNIDILSQTSLQCKHFFKKSFTCLKAIDQLQNMSQLLTGKVIFFTAEMAAYFSLAIVDQGLKICTAQAEKNILYTLL